MGDSTPLPVENPRTASAADPPDATPERVESALLVDEQPEESPPASATIDPVPTEPAPAAYSPYGDPNTVLVIPRVTLNYVVIAVVFFFLGAAIAGGAVSAIFNANSSENRALIENAVTTALRDLGATGQQGLVQGERYEVSADDDPSLGAPDAPITIIEFSDFRCPYCGRFFNETLTPLMDDYEGQVRLVYRDYPILGPVSVEAAVAGECANLQDKFWAFHDLAFENQQTLSRDTFLSIADQIGVDIDEFTACLDGQATMGEIRSDATYAQQLGVTGTPAFFINGRFVSGAQPYAVFAAIINEELGQLEESTPEPNG